MVFMPIGQTRIGQPDFTPIRLGGSSWIAPSNREVTGSDIEKWGAALGRRAASCLIQ